MSPSSILLGLAGFDGRLEFVNDAWKNVLGYPPQELLDRLLADDGFDSMELASQCADGACRWFLWQRRFDSEHQAMFIAGHDITEQKSREIASLLRSYQASKTTAAASD